MWLKYNRLERRVGDIDRKVGRTDNRWPFMLTSELGYCGASNIKSTTKY